MMYLLLSGEGKGDMGECTNEQGRRALLEYRPGAMAQKTEDHNEY